MHVWVLMIQTYDEGADAGFQLEIFSTQVAAKTFLYAWVCEEWNEGRDGADEEPSGLVDSDIQKFFNYYEDLFRYHLYEKEVQGPELIEADVLDLTPDEVQLLLLALNETQNKGIPCGEFDCTDQTRHMELKTTRIELFKKLKG